MQPSPKRNRIIEGRRVAELAHAYRLQLNEKQCAQKELNLQPAGYKGIGPEPESPFRLRLRAREAARQARQNAEASCGNRNQSVTEAGPFPAPSHKADAAEYALANRPNIFAFLEAVTLAAAMGATRVWR